MAWGIIIGLVLIYALYAPIAELIFHMLHVGTLYKGTPTERKIGLTFDDGPDPRYTPQVLQILDEHDAKATFFVVGAQAEQFPNIVREIVAEGHEVAIHGDKHRHAWLLDPIATYRDLKAAMNTIASISGHQMRYYRPPWGAFNIMTRAAAAHFKLTPVLWSSRAKDWYAGHYAKEIVQRVVNEAHPSGIVLCHDAGGADGAPLNTIEALPTILTELKALGYAFTTVSDIHQSMRSHRAMVRQLFAHYPWYRKLWISLWEIVEVTFARYYHVEPLNTMFRFSPAKWDHGSRLDPDTGMEQIHDGAQAIDLHFRNDTAVTLSASHDNRALVRGLRLVKQGFGDLARVLEHDPKYHDVQVVVATTLMNRGMEMLGFHVEGLPDTRKTRRLQRYMRFLMGLYHPEGFSRLHHGRHNLELKLIWMTRDELIARYGEHKAVRGREKVHSK
jgi:peptidoglycan/xylan/chitin deacetylase (PgdA/CDA1 family)